MRAPNAPNMTLRSMVLAVLWRPVCRRVESSAAQPGGSDERVAIKAGKLLDVRTGKYRSQVFVGVEHGRITALSNAAPEGARH